jgi:hypothetical protein
MKRPQQSKHCRFATRGARARAARSLAPFVLLVAAALALPLVAAAGPKCPDMMVSADDLDDVLVQTLGSLRNVVDQRSVSIDPSTKSCYVQFSLTTSALAQLGAACKLQACSTVLYRQKSIALREFDVAGCEPLFSIFGLSRHVPSTYVDASARIRQQCGSDDFEIDGVAVVQLAQEPKIRIRFRPKAAAQ